MPVPDADTKLALEVAKERPSRAAEPEASARVEP